MKVTVSYILFVFLEVFGGRVNPVLVIVSLVEVEVLPLLLFNSPETIVHDEYPHLKGEEIK